MGNDLNIQDGHPFIESRKGSGLIAAAKVAIRDDDVSFFTDTGRFERSHAFLIRNRIPFTAAVIPEADPTAGGLDGKPEGFLPGRPSAGSGVRAVDENPDLIRFLAGHEFIEIAQHGLSHKGSGPGVPEFDLADGAEAGRRLDRGLSVLLRSFGKRTAFFVPPRDSVSPAALGQIRLRFKGVCLSRFSHSLLPPRLWPAFLLAERRGHYGLRWGGFRMVRHPGADFSAPEASGRATLLSRPRDVLVLPLHSWRFFDGRGGMVRSLLDPWEDFLKRVADSGSARFVPLSEA
jgi:hypothetical protein